MAMMAKMRSLAPAFIITVGALFVLFMIISDSNVLEVLGARSNNVGSINGEDISYQEFMKVLEQQRETQKNQTGQDIEEENMDQFREQVWDAIVTQTLFSQQIQKFGITVSDEEVRDVILGDNPPEFLKQNFIDSTGQFNRQLYEQALFDPRNKEPLLQAEEYVRQNRLNEKLQSMLTASIVVTEPELKRKFTDQNINMKVQYAVADLSIFPDSVFKVTDEELRKFYEENIQNYSIKAQRKLKYVMFPFKPTQEDSENVRKGLESIVENLKVDTGSFKDNVGIYSTAPYSKDTLAASGLSAEAINKMVNAASGSIIGPVTSPEGYAIYRLESVVPSNETMVRASHILIAGGDDAKGLEEAMKVYNQLIEGANFEKLAKEKSTDPGSGQKGGDLGWFGRGAMVPEFEKACFDGAVGVVQKPVKTNFGYHIIKVTGKTNNKYVVEKIVNPVKPSATTYDFLQNTAREFSFVAEKNGFEQEAKLLNYQVQETPPFVEESYSIPGLGVNKRLLDFAFKNGVNTVSEVYKVQQGYVVALVSEVINEGAQEFDKIKEQLKPGAIREKKFEKAKELITGLKGKIGNDLFKAKQIDPRVNVDTASGINGNSVVPNVGKDYAFLQKAQTLQLNQVSEPFKGNRGYYLIKVVERNSFDNNAYQLQRNTLRDALLQEKKSSFFNQWVTKLKKDSDIEDNRHIFFGL